MTRTSQPETLASPPDEGARPATPPQRHGPTRPEANDSPREPWREVEALDRRRPLLPERAPQA